MRNGPRQEVKRASSEVASQRDEDKMVAQSKYLAGLADDPKSHYHGQLAEDEIDFIIVRHAVGPNDPCPCKSGKVFRDCHWDEVKNSS